jgi:hypothetical protein
MRLHHKSTRYATMGVSTPARHPQNTIENGQQANPVAA